MFVGLVLNAIFTGQSPNLVWGCQRGFPNRTYIYRRESMYTKWEKLSIYSLCVQCVYSHYSRWPILVWTLCVHHCWKKILSVCGHCVYNINFIGDVRTLCVQELFVWTLCVQNSLCGQRVYNELYF